MEKLAFVDFHIIKLLNLNYGELNFVLVKDVAEYFTFVRTEGQILWERLNVYGCYNHDFSHP